MSLRGLSMVSDRFAIYTLSKEGWETLLSPSLIVLFSNNMKLMLPKSTWEHSVVTTDKNNLLPCI